MDVDSQNEGRRRFSRRDLVVVILVCCVLAGLALPAIQLARQNARQLHCANGLLQIGMALSNYHEAHQQFPPAFFADPQGKPRSSWRVAIFPFHNGSPFYDLYSFNEPWNSPSNLNLAERNDGSIFYCPADPPYQATTNYLAVTGAATAWPTSGSSRLGEFVNPARSILVVESVKTGIHWLEPRDLEFDQLQLTIHATSWMGSQSRPSNSSRWSNSSLTISSGHPNGANVLFGDGSLEFLATDTSQAVLQEMLVIGGTGQDSLGPRDRLRLVVNTALTEDQQASKPYSFKLEAFTLNDAEGLNR